MLFSLRNVLDSLYLESVEQKELTYAELEQANSVAVNAVYCVKEGSFVKRLIMLLYGLLSNNIAAPKHLVND